MNIKKINLFGILFLGSLLVGSFLFLNSCQSHIDSQYNFDGGTSEQDTNDDQNNNNDNDDDEDTPPEVKSLMEIGSVTLNSTWKQISFTHKIINPIIIMGPARMSDPIPTSIRIKNVDEEGFEARLYDEDNSVPAHTEIVSWLAIKSGKHTLSDGTTIEAGTINTNIDLNDSGDITVTFQSAYTNAPVVYSSNNTFNNDMYLNTRAFSVTTTQFHLGNDTLESSPGDLTNDETIAWVAIVPQGETLNDNYQTQTQNGTPKIYSFTDILNKGIFASSQERVNGVNPIGMRISSISGNNIAIRIYEDTSLDVEQNHATEAVSVILFNIGIVEE